MFPEVHLCYNSSSTSGTDMDPFVVCVGTHIWCFFTLLWAACGIPAYVVMFCHLYKTHRHGTPITPSIFFMLNLSIMDIIFLVSIPPGMLNYYIIHSILLEALWNSLYSFSICGRPLLMACICLDCYLAVIHPLIYRQWKSLTPRILMALIVWILTIACGIFYFINLTIYMSFFSIIPYLIALVIIVICDFFILYTLMKPGPSGNNIHSQKQKAIQTLVNSLVIAIISYLLPVLLFAFGKSLISDATKFFCIISVPMTISSTMGSAVMPFLYLSNEGKFDCFRLKFSRKS